MTQLPSESLRVAALEQAVALYGVGNETDIIGRADLFLHWLRAGGTPHHVRLRVTDPVAEDDSTPLTAKGSVAMAQITTSEKFKITADPEDASGYDVDVPVVFTSDNEAVASIVDIPEDPKSVYVVSGDPGSAVVTAVVTTQAGENLTATLAVDVITGDVARVNLIAGDPEAE